MTKKRYVPLKEAMDEGRRQSDKYLIPVFTRIIKIDGVLHGELLEYSDEFGNRYHLSEAENLLN